AIIEDYYQARARAQEENAEGVTYRPLLPDKLYFTPGEWEEKLGGLVHARLTPFSVPGAISAGASLGRTFAPERKAAPQEVFEALRRHVAALQGAKKKTVLACWSRGALERLAPVLADHGLSDTLALPDAGA